MRRALRLWLIRPWTGASGYAASGMNGMETFKRIKTIDAKLPVIIITAYSTTELAIEATKLGAYDIS